MDTAIDKNMKNTEMHKYMRNMDTVVPKMTNIDNEVRKLTIMDTAMNTYMKNTEVHKHDEHGTAMHKI
jgi:hypothetical protein